MKTLRTAFLLSLLLAVAAIGRAQVPVAEELRFQKLNRVYADFVPPLEEVNQGGVVVKLASPKQTLILRDHRVRLTPGAAGVFDGTVELEVQGKGILIADVTFGPLAERFTEEVIVPPQKLALAGKARLVRVEGGYEIVPIELPERLAVAVQSQTVNQILTLCDRTSLVSLGAIDCTGLERALTHPSIPIPQGQTFTLHDSDLTDEDRRELDALIAVR